MPYVALSNGWDQDDEIVWLGSLDDFVEANTESLSEMELWELYNGMPVYGGGGASEEFQVQFVQQLTSE